MVKVMDWEKALDAVDGSEDILEELAGLFVDESPGMLEQIRAAIDDGDAGELQRNAHSLKSSARIFAAEPATEAAFRLEAMGRDRQFDGAVEAWEALKTEVERLSAALAAQLGR